MSRAAIALLLVACGAEHAARDTIPPAPAGETAADTSYPTPRRGALVARAVTERALDGHWTARGTACPSPPAFQLLARGDTVDVLILLRLPQDEAAPGGYKVLGPLDSTDAPRTARVGVQRMQYVDLAYRGFEGTVWLERLDRSATGRFDIVLDEAVSHDRVRYLGVFDAVPVDSGSAAACTVAAP